MTPGKGIEHLVDQVAQLLHVRIGLRPDHLRGRLRRAIRDEADRLSADPASYVHRLLADDETLQGLMDRLTVQETGFFRHPEQFEVLARDVLPALRQPVKIWSAACANGEEAYSLAMVLEEQGIEGSVLATDVSTAALRRTHAARYEGRELAGLSPERMARHVVRDGDAWQVAESVRRRVTTQHHNLMCPLPTEARTCQVVFCRNVLFSLSPNQVRAFLDRIADDLGPAVTLFVGAAETVWQVSDRFHAVQAGGAFQYHPRVDVGASPAPTSSRRSQAGSPRSNGPATAREPTRLGRSRKARAGTPEAGESGPRPPSTATSAEAVDPTALEKAGQVAMAVGDFAAAVVAFRRCAYLIPHDPLAQLHLGLALEAADDKQRARRAFAAARRALLEAGSEQRSAGLEGWSAAELLSFLESKT
jgi:chemotaxis protein methyltransferase CheR